MKIIFSLIWLLYVITTFITNAKVQQIPGDNCDERITRWCDFDSGLWCRTGKCQCVKNYMTFNAEKQRCVSKVWFPCGDLSTGDLKIPKTDCVDNAACVLQNREKPQGARECRCFKGFNETDEGFCS